MKNTLKLFAILIVLISNTSFAQNNRIYDINTFTETKGKVLKILEIIPSKGVSGGIHIVLNTGSEDLSVHLGPKWYLDKQSVQLKTGDKIEVKGSKVIIDGTEAIIAREIIKDGNILKLRDTNGIPYWSGKGRR
jgi:hypothetical protein